MSVLLSHLHPTSTRVDGSGGDGGRDVQITTTDGIRAFELKSFTGRMGDAQRAQVKKSLEKGTELKPLDWTLIVPIDFTPGEADWFEGLRALVPFPIDRRDLAWLQGQPVATADESRSGLLERLPEESHKRPDAAMGRLGPLTFT